MSTILGIKSTHDGTLAYLKNCELVFSIEAEKDSGFRYQSLTIEQVIGIIRKLPEIPQAIAVGGWNNVFVGYSGLNNIKNEKINVFGEEIMLFSSSHERSHLLGSYAMSPFPQGQPCYALLWEGTIGSFYFIDEKLQITKFSSILSNPGWRYSYPYYLAIDSVAVGPKWGRNEMAGKMMALAGWPRRSELSDDDNRLVDWILDQRHPTALEAQPLFYLPSDKGKIPIATGIVNKGVDNPDFRNFAAHFSDRLFQVFYDQVKQCVKNTHPLLVSGGCGLNCEWNTKWRDCGLFSEVFVPPCPNDSGSAIGSAVDAQMALTGNAKIKWSVYAGEAFVNDCPTPDGWRELRLSNEAIVKYIGEGDVIAWVHGRYEIGPRALGNRSLLAEPFSKKSRDKLNLIKKREAYRPIAPICLEEDVSRHFSWTGESPYMLYFQEVLDESLRAITHDDGSARVQTVNKEQNAPIYNLLSSYKNFSGKGVLCNTSLNFPGRGFINRKTHLFQFANLHSLRCLVIDDRMFLRE